MQTPEYLSGKGLTWIHGFNVSNIYSFMFEFGRFCCKYVIRIENVILQRRKLLSSLVSPSILSVGQSEAEPPKLSEPRRGQGCLFTETLVNFPSVSSPLFAGLSCIQENTFYSLSPKPTFVKLWESQWDWGVTTMAWLQSYKAWCDNAIGHNGFKLQVLFSHVPFPAWEKRALCASSSHPSVPPSLTVSAIRVRMRLQSSSVSEGVSH